MAEASNYLRDFLGAGEAAFDPKQSSVAAAALEKKEALSKKGYTGSAEVGAGFAPRPMDFNEDILDSISAGTGRSEYMVDATGQRSTMQAVGDVANDAASAALMGIPQIANIGIGTVSPSAGAVVSRFIEEGLANARDKKSDESQGRDRAYGARQGVSSDHNEALYQDDIANGLSSFEAGLRRVGRDATASIRNSDSVNVSSTVATGLGSLLTAGPLGKALGALGKGAMPAAVGLQEGGAAHHAVMNQVLNTSHEDLMSGSEDYRQAILEGSSPEDARNAVARNAGLQAAAISGVAGAGIGAIPGMSRLEAAPFRVGSARGAASNILRETVEEAAQGATGGFAENIAIKGKADSSRDLLANVGENVGQGAIGGLGTAAAVQAPGAALQAAVAAVVIPAKAAAKGVNSLLSRGAKIRDDVTVEEADRILTEASTTVADPEVQAQIEAGIETVSTEATEVEEARGYVGKLFEALSTDKIDALNADIAKISDEATSPEEQEEAALNILDMSRDIAVMTDSGLPKALDVLMKDDPQNPLVKQVEAMRQALNMMGAHPNVRAALEAADAKRQAKVETVDESVNSETDTAPDERVVNNTARLAEYRPDQVSPSAVDRILKHAERGEVALTPEQSRALKGAATLSNEVKERKARAERLGLKTSKEVSNDILIGDRDSALKDAKSMATYMGEINSAMRVGNTELARTRLQEMLDFTQHMQNKVGAINESLAKGGGKANQGSYISRDPVTGQMAMRKQFGITPQSINSVRLAHEVENDAKSIAAVANYLVQTYKELGLKPVTEVELHESLRGKAENVVKNYLSRADNSEKTSPETTTITEFSATPEPAETGQPKGGDTSVEAKPAKQAEEREDTGSSIQEPREEPTPAPVTETVTEALEEAIEKPIEKIEPEERAAAPEVEVSQPIVEPTPEPVVEEPKVDLSTVDGAYPGLVENSWFYKNFTIAKGRRSNLIGVARPIEHLGKLLGQGHDALAEFAQRALNNTVDRKVFNGFSQLFHRADEMRDVLIERLGKALDKRQNERKQDPLKTMLEFREDKVFHLTQPVEDTLAYNEELLQGAILAGLNWVMTSGQQGRVYKDEDIAKILGIEEDAVQNEHRQWFNAGLYLTDGVDSLTQTIFRFWGAKPNSNDPVGAGRGVAEAMAKEILVALEIAGLIKLSRLDFKDGETTVSDALTSDKTTETGAKSYLHIETTLDDDIKLGNGFSDLLDQVISVEPEPDIILNKPSKRIDKFQDRSRLVEVTKQQQEVQEKAQATPQYVNPTMVKVLNAIGGARGLNLFGYGDVSEQSDLNKQDWESRKGFNLTISGAFNHLFQMLAKVNNAAETAGTPVEQVKIFYEYGFSKVGRLHAQGSYNPQANKLVREVVLGTRSTIDLTDDKMKSVFMLAIGQHWGEKVHKQPRMTTVKKVSELADKKYTNSLKILQKWLKAGAAKPFSDSDLATFKAEFGDKASPGALHAAVEYARYLNASTAERSKFETQLYVEADGVTDGPINALMHLSVGEFTPHWIKMMAKGGLFFANGIRTLNDYMALPDPEAQDDLYTSAAKGTYANLAKFAKDLQQAGNAPVGIQLAELLLAMTELLGSKSIEYDPHAKTLTIDRGLTKNPLTVTVYGSGKKGLANKLVGEMISAFYEKLSDGNISPSLERSMKELTNKYVGQKDGKMYIGKKVTSPLVTGKDYKFSRGQIENLTNNVLSLFVNSLEGGITDVIGVEVNEARNALRGAIQVQSIIVGNAYRTAVAAAVKASNVPSHLFLSEQAMDKIHAEIAKKFHLLIKTGTQTFYPAGSEAVELNDPKEKKSRIELSRTLDEKISTPYRVPGPADAGVRGIPYVVIGTGDGQMIMNIISDPNAPEGALYVFDGVNVKLSTAEADSEVINKAVLKGWTANPLDAVAKAYAAFIKDGGHKQWQDLSETELVALQRALGSDGKDFAPETDMETLSVRLSEMALESQARKNVLGRVNLSIDHMASLEAPHTVEDKLQLDGTPEEITQQLNKLYRLELAKLKGEPAVEATAETSEAEPEAGQQQTTLIIQPLRKAMMGILRRIKNPEQRSVVVSAIKALENDGWTVIQGKLEDLIEHASKNTRGQLDSTKKIHGFMSARNKTIYIVGTDPETISHELIHAATYAKVVKYYEDPKSVSKDDAEAINRIQSLMYEWLSETEENSQPEVLNLREEIFAENQSPEGNAVALNEFMAWMLTNEKLIEQAQKLSTPRIITIAKRAIEAIKKFVFGNKLSPKNDLYSNLRFNSEILITSSQPSLAERAQGVLFHQSASNGAVNRLTLLGGRINTILNSLVGSDPIGGQTKVDAAQLIGNDIQLAYDAHGFPMSNQEKLAFIMITQLLATEADLDPNSLVRAQELFNHVIKNLTVEDFMSDPTDNAQRFYANEKYNTVLGNNLTLTDAQGRSTLLPAFVALATTNDEFRNVLINMPLPKGEKNKSQSLDAIIENFGTDQMNNLSRRVSGERGTDVRAAVDSLVDRLSKTVIDQENVIVQTSTNIGNHVDKGNDILVNFKDEWVGKGVDKLEDIAATTNNKYVGAAASTAAAILSIISEDKADEISTGVLHMAARANLWHWPRELLNEIVGRTSENKNVYDLIKKVRSHIQQFRQQFREHMPTKIAEQFSRKLSRDEWSKMFEGIARTDIAMLRDQFTQAKVINLLKQPSLIASEIATLESSLLRSHPNEAALFIRKAKELADYMNTGRVVTSNLLRNAHAIAELHGEVRRSNAPNPTNALVRTIDALTSLYAFDGTSQQVKDVISDLATNEADGLNYVLAQLEGSRRDEMAKVNNSSQARVNYFKGHVPSEQRPGVSMVVSDDVDKGKLELRGYKRVADYKGSQAERGSTKRGYYFAPMSAKAPFSQGIMQNVRATASGVDPITGFSIGSITGGMITDPYLVEQARLRQSRNNAATENLMPVYDQNGKLIAWERSTEPNESLRLEKNTQLHEVIGVWKGRQIEEAMADEFNHKLIDELKVRYNEDVINGHKADYINIFDKKELRRDKVLADAVRLITPQTRAYIESQFEEGEFWVSRNSINDSIGYRSPSVGDAWTGNTRLPPEVTKQMRNMITGIFGKDAYKYAITAEKFWQNFVSDARTTIVVRSGIVPVANMISNIYHLADRGVPVADIIRGIPRKTAEINRYVNMRLEQMSLQADLEVAKVNNDIRAQRKAEQAIQAINDAWSRMSIWPLIEAGEFTSISDAGISQEETLLVEGKLTSYIEGLADKLPASVRTAGRYAIVSKDTALFQGLQKSVAYGDFIAKAVLYDDLTRRKKQSGEYALGRITEEFVNYDRLAGRSRSYLENSGLLWFWNFKIRAIKIAVSVVRNNPLHALFIGLAPSPDIFGSIGSPMTDNAVSVIVDGRSHWSIGPGMGVNAYYLNPTVQILGNIT